MTNATTDATTKGTTHGFPVPPPLLAAAAAVAQRALTPDPAPSTPRRVVASALTLGSVALAGSASGLFRRTGTTVNPVRLGGSTSLVVSGPFSVTRNPMYVGMAGLLLAHAVHRGHPAGLLPLAAWVGVIDRLQVRAEEASMHELFGAEYDAYRARVPRWLGPAH